MMFYNVQDFQCVLSCTLFRNPPLLPPSFCKICYFVFVYSIQITQLLSDFRDGHTVVHCYRMTIHPPPPPTPFPIPQEQSFFFFTQYLAALLPFNFLRHDWSNQFLVSHPKQWVAQLSNALLKCKLLLTQSKSKTQVTKSVHCKFNCITVAFSRTWQSIYKMTWRR